MKKMITQRQSQTYCKAGWRRSVVVSALAWSTKLINTGPGYYLDGWLLTDR